MFTALLLRGEGECSRHYYCVGRGSVHGIIIAWGGGVFTALLLRGEGECLVPG